MKIQILGSVIIFLSWSVTATKTVGDFLKPLSQLNGLSDNGENVNVNDTFLWLLRIGREKSKKYHPNSFHPTQ